MHAASNVRLVLGLACADERHPCVAGQQARQAAEEAAADEGGMEAERVHEGRAWLEAEEGATAQPDMITRQFATSCLTGRRLPATLGS